MFELTDGRGADLALDTVGGTLCQPALTSLRFNGRMTGILTAPEPHGRLLRGRFSHLALCCHIAHEPVLA